MLRTCARDMPSLSLSRMAGVIKFPWRMSILCGVKDGSLGVEVLPHALSSSATMINFIYIEILVYNGWDATGRIIPIPDKNDHSVGFVFGS